MNSTDTPVLYQFAFSHFNEKVRWALDWKGIDHERRSLLPGPHRRTAMKLSGQPQTPFMIFGDRAVTGTADILRHLEALQPEPTLYPGDDESRRKIDEWVQWLDNEVGPAVRLGLFHAIFAEPKTAAKLFTTQQPKFKSVPYSLLLPRLIPMLRKYMRINAATAERDNKLTLAALDRIGSGIAATGYLVGAQFSAADLTAAALLFPLTFPPELPFELPSGPSAALDKWKARWASHSTLDWVHEIFRKHRGSWKRA